MKIVDYIYIHMKDFMSITPSPGVNNVISGNSFQMNLNFNEKAYSLTCTVRSWQQIFSFNLSAEIVVTYTLQFLLPILITFDDLLQICF